MNIVVTPPKMLPWLAHKAGIEVRRAEELWRASLKHAAHVAPTGSSEFWRTAMDELLELIARESRHQDDASFGWRPWSRGMKRLLDSRLDAIDEIALTPIRTLRMLDHQGRHASRH